MLHFISVCDRNVNEYSLASDVVPLYAPLSVLSSEFDQVFAKAAAYDENLAFLRTMLQALHR